jgi:hypothetical protein
MTTPTDEKGPMMHQRYDTNSAAARSMRIRRAHDLEATALDTMHRRADRETSGVLARFLARWKVSAPPLRPEQGTTAERQLVQRTP